MAVSSSRVSRRNHKNRRNRRHRVTRVRPVLSPGVSGAGLGLIGSLVGTAAFSQGSEVQDQQQQEESQYGESYSLMSGGGGGGGGGGSSNTERKPGCVNDIADHILCFLELLNTIKIYHWSTLSYSTHKATDELHTTLSKLVDSFIEIYIGHCARRGKGGDGVPVFNFKSDKAASIEFCECKTLEAFCKVLDDNIVHLERLNNKLSKYTDLVNIRDEIVGALAQALYLLRLE